MDLSKMIKVRGTKRELPSKVEVNCKICGTAFQGKTIHSYCSDQCRVEGAKVYEQKRSTKKTRITCAVCDKPFEGGRNQRYCSPVCRKEGYGRGIKKFHAKNPDAMKGYNKNRIKKNPDTWRQKWLRERTEIITALGGKCIVCNVTNPNWLHVDYIPTMQGTGYRHPRHKRWVLENIKDFRLLCANHHYELTLTGKIEGTSITQAIKKSSK